MKIESIDGTDVVQQIGYSENELNEIIKILQSQDENKRNIFNTWFQGKPLKYIHINLGVFYTIGVQDIFTDIVLADNGLQAEFITLFRRLFNLPENYGIRKLLEAKSTGIVIDVLVKNLMIMGTNECDNSLYRHNFTYSPYIRKTISNTNNISYYTPEPQQFGNVKIKMSNNFYNLDNTVMESLYNTYNRKYLSGPSGTISVTFYFIKKILKRDMNKNTFLVMLALAMVDFIPGYHTLPEILQGSIPEFIKIDNTVPPYTLDKDPYVYLRDEFVNYVNS